MRTPLSTDFVITSRGGVIENRHAVHAAIVDSTGTLLHSVGDPSRLTLARSAAKPAQAVSILETGALEKYNLTEADLALMCASHSSEDHHIARARAILAQISASENDLQCGGHVPVSDAVHRNWIKADFTPTPVCSNCSGKHAGMIAAAKALGADVASYHLPGHPLQKRIFKTVDEICGLGTGESKWGLDGCNLPAPAFPLNYLARMYAAFADASRVPAGDYDGSESTRLRSMSRVFHAMARYPENVGGEDRFCTILMGAFGGELIGKLGADGCYGIGVRESSRTREIGATGGIGIAVKIEDGSIPILYSAVAEILEQLRIGEPHMRRALDKFHSFEVKNTVGVVTGTTAPQFKIRSE
jgi:L-asparaginase II